MRTVFEAQLFIRSPHLDQLTLEHLQTVISRKPARIGTYSDVAFSRVLASKGTVPEGLEIHRPVPDRKSSPALTRGVPSSGQLMAGRIIYSYPIFRAIQDGYVKRLKAVVLKPQTLRYVREEDGQEIEVSLEEVRRLGEEDAGFRCTIVTSQETMNTIVDASIRELQKLRANSGEKRLKIIASALNHTNCGKVVEAYRARGLKADYVHSQEDGKANDAILKKLHNHEAVPHHRVSSWPQATWRSSGRN